MRKYSSLCLAVFLVPLAFYPEAGKARGLNALNPAEAPAEEEGKAQGDDMEKEMGGEVAPLPDEPDGGKKAQDRKSDTEAEETEATDKASPAVPATPAPATPATPAPATPQSKPSRVSKLLRERLLIGTSFGLTRISKAGNTWRGSGASDLRLAYRLAQKIGGGHLFVSLRYAPMDVAPQIEKDGVTGAYSGIIQAYHTGVSWRLPLQKNMQAVAQAELGFVTVGLTDELLLAEDDPPDEPGFLVTLGGGADWELIPRFTLGPRLYVGFGSFTTIQLSGSATFAF